MGAWDGFSHEDGFLGSTKSPYADNSLYFYAVWGTRYIRVCLWEFGRVAVYRGDTASPNPGFTFRNSRTYAAKFLRDHFPSLPLFPYGSDIEVPDPERIEVEVFFGRGSTRVMLPRGICCEDVITNPEVRRRVLTLGVLASLGGKA